MFFPVTYFINFQKLDCSVPIWTEFLVSSILQHVGGVNELFHSHDTHLLCIKGNLTRDCSNWVKKPSIVMVNVEVCNLRNVSHVIIFCSAGTIRNLSPNLWHLTHLTSLYLNDNCLSRIPPDISRLVNLRTLDLSSNKLRSLPAELGELIYLR